MARLKSLEEIKRSIELCERSIQNHRNGIAKAENKLISLHAEYKEYEKAMGKFKYRKGQAVYHKEYGNCLICGLHLSPQKVRTYKILLLDQETIVVDEVELLPITQATEVLYTQGKHG